MTIKCSKCGRPVSNEVDDTLFLRAYVLCLDCEAASRESILQRFVRLLKPTNKRLVGDIIRQVYDNTLTQGFELGRQYERAHAEGTGVIMSARVTKELEEILRKGGSKP